MKTDFCDRTEVVARKQHFCGQCLTTIDPGTKYIRWAGVQEGDFYTSHEHIECREAFAAYGEMVGLDWDEVWPRLHQIIEDRAEWGDPSWMRGRFPVVADRLGIPHKPSQGVGQPSGAPDGS